MKLALLTEQVCRIAMDAGNFLREERKTFCSESVEKKHAHDYVSYVDKESEKQIVAALSLLLPEAGFITEEGSAVYQDEPYCWVVDPLDGTTNYIHDNAPYCVCIALRSREELLLGVVYDPCRDECFYGWQDGGASGYIKRAVAAGLRPGEENAGHTPDGVLPDQRAFQGAGGRLSCDGAG